MKKSRTIMNVPVRMSARASQGFGPGVGGLGVLAVVCGRGGGSPAVAAGVRAGVWIRVELSM